MKNKLSIILGCFVSVVMSGYARADSWSGQDKANHVAISAAVSKLTKETHGGAAGVALALLPGVAKELSDLSGSGTPSIKDMTANFLGAIVGSALPRQYMLAPIGSRGGIDGVVFAYVGDLP